MSEATPDFDHLEDRMSPEQAQAAREAYKAKYGDADFQPSPDQGPQLITEVPKNLAPAAAETPAEPYVKPVHEDARPRIQVIEAQLPIEPKQ